MSRSRFDQLLRIVTVVGLLVLSLSAAAEQQPPASMEARLLSLRLEPQTVRLSGAKAAQRFLVLGRYSDGLTREVTSGSRFTISDSGVARLSSPGRVVAVGEGRAILEAEKGGEVATATIVTTETRKDRPFSFALDIGGILTKRGCNGSSCHGGVKGRGGFRLSSDATEPAEDYEWIVKGGGYQVLTSEALEPRNPRVDFEQPMQSLLLLKPTARVSHGGGKRLEEGSADYHTILNWVRRGAPYANDGNEGLQIERLDVFPKEAVLDREGRHQLVVTAHLSDGRQAEITDQVRFESLNEEVVKVSPEGLVQAVGIGEAAVLVRSAGQAADARFAVIGRPIVSFPQVARHNFIDDEVFDKLRRFHRMPSELSGDQEFLRRVCLDVTGTLPPPERVREFVASGDPDKRSRLIEALLNSPEYVDYWTFRFADFFRVRGHYRWVHTYWEWVRKSVAINKPYDQMARESIAAQGYDGPSRIYLIDDNKPPALERVVAEQFRVFMGRRMDCAQCHNHPYDRWSQDQFWGLAAFFGRITNTEWAFDNVVFDDPNGHEVNFGEAKSFLAFRKTLHPRTKQLVPPRFPDGRLLAAAARRDPRLQLAKWMTAHPYFAEAAVNRIWGHFFGRGIVDPVDDFRLGNPPTHPKLLQLLARDFEKHSYDLKHLIRRIVSSRTYQLSSRTDGTHPEDKLNFSHALPRPLEAEVLLDAISNVTGVPELFKANGMITGTAPPGTRAINLKYPASYDSRFLEVYQRPKRDVVVKRSGKVNLMQALHMTVSPTYNDKLARQGGRLDRLLKRGASDREVIEEVYLAALSRFPTQPELAGLEQLIRAQPSRRGALEDFLWAVICSREFADNH